MPSGGASRVWDMSASWSRTRRQHCGVVERQNLDAVVWDVRMEGTNGFELLDRVKRTHPALPFVVSTRRAHVAKARALGVPRANRTRVNEELYIALIALTCAIYPRNLRRFVPDGCPVQGRCSQRALHHRVACPSFLVIALPSGSGCGRRRARAQRKDLTRSLGPSEQTAA